MVYRRIVYDVETRRRDTVLREAVTTDEGFQIVGEELLRPMLDLIDYEMRPRGSLFHVPRGRHPRRLILSVRVPVGIRAHQGIHTIDAISDRALALLRRAMQRYNAHPERDRGRWAWPPRIESFHIEHRHGWQIALPIVSYV